jgi:single-strand DNA-binding protein
MNKVMLIGNLGDDPEIRHLNSGSKVLSLRLATSEKWKDKSGERKERTEWHTVVVFSEPLIDVLEKYTRKGSKIFVEGKLQTRKWQDKDGHDKYATEVVLQQYEGKIELLSPRDDNGGGRDDRGDDRHQEQRPKPTKRRPVEDDDSIPF